MRRIDLIIIHCTASRPDQHISLEMLDQMRKACPSFPVSELRVQLKELGY